MSAVQAGPQTLSLYHLLDPEVLANPYPLCQRLRTEDPAHWDPFLHAWVVTRHADAVAVLHRFSAQRTPSPQQLTAMGLADLNPVAQVMVRQMLFMDPPAHTRIRGLAAHAFDRVRPTGRMDVIADLGAPLPAIVTAEMLGVPVEDHVKLKDWSQDFAEILGNFQHNPERAARVLHATEAMVAFRRARDAARFIAPRATLRAILARYLEVAPREVRFAPGPHGKPRVPGAPLRFNVSHADDVALYVVAADREVGVDVERRGDVVDDERVAARVLSPRELAWLRGAGRARRADAFFDLWVPKEAYAKALGVGLAGEPRELEVVPTPEGWSIENVPGIPEFAAAVAAPGEPRRIACWEWGRSSAPLAG